MDANELRQPGDGPSARVSQPPTHVTEPHDHPQCEDPLPHQEAAPVEDVFPLLPVDGANVALLQTKSTILMVRQILVVNGPPEDTETVPTEADRPEEVVVASDGIPPSVGDPAGEVTPREPAVAGDRDPSVTGGSSDLLPAVVEAGHGQDTTSTSCSSPPSHQGGSSPVHGPADTPTTADSEPSGPKAKVTNQRSPPVPCPPPNLSPSLKSPASQAAVSGPASKPGCPAEGSTPMTSPEPSTSVVSTAAPSSQTTTLLLSPGGSVRRVFGQLPLQPRPTVPHPTTLLGQGARVRLPRPKAPVVLGPRLGPRMHIPELRREGLTILTPQQGGIIRYPRTQTTVQQTPTIVTPPNPDPATPTPTQPLVTPASPAITAISTGGPQPTSASTQTSAQSSAQTSAQTSALAPAPKVSRIVSLLSTRTIPDLNKVGVVRQRSESESSTIGPGTREVLGGGRQRRSSQGSASRTSMLSGFPSTIRVIPTTSASTSVSTLTAQHSTLARALQSPQKSQVLASTTGAATILTRPETPPSRQASSPRTKASTEGLASKSSILHQLQQPRLTTSEPGEALQPTPVASVLGTVQHATGPKTKVVIIRSPPATRTTPPGGQTLSEVTGVIPSSSNPGLKYRLVTRSPSGQTVSGLLDVSKLGVQGGDTQRVLVGSSGVTLGGVTVRAVQPSVTGTSAILQTTPSDSSPKKSATISVKPSMPLVRPQKSPATVQATKPGTSTVPARGNQSKAILSPGSQPGQKPQAAAPHKSPKSVTAVSPKVTGQAGTEARSTTTSTPALSSPTMLSVLRAPPLYSQEAPSPSPLGSPPASTVKQDLRAVFSSPPGQSKVMAGSPGKSKLPVGSQGKKKAKGEVSGKPSTKKSESAAVSGGPKSVALKAGRSLTIGTSVAAVGSSLSVKAQSSSVNVSQPGGGFSKQSASRPPGGQKAGMSGQAPSGGTGEASAIVVPMASISGMEAIQQLLKGSSAVTAGAGTMQIKLPPGITLPSQNRPVKISIITPEQAQRLGLQVPSPAQQGKPSTSSSIRIHQGTGQVIPQVAPATTTPPGGQTLSGVTGVIPSSSSPGLNQPPPGGAPPTLEKTTDQEEEPSIPQVDGTGDEKMTEAAKTKSTAPQEDPASTTSSGQEGQHEQQAPTPMDVTDTDDVIKTSAKCPAERPPRRIIQRERVSMTGRDLGDGSRSHTLYQKVDVVARPWRTTDGTVNRPTLKLMLEAVLIWIMAHPGITYDDLVTKYNPILQPVPIAELVQVLEELGCIHVSTVRGSHTCSLFSQRSAVSCGVRKTGTETLIYTPRVDCILKLGQFEAQLVGGATKS